MTREEAKKLLALIKVAYPNSYKDMDRDFALATVNMWQSTFPEVPYVIMETAFNQFRKKSKFPPTVADMYEELQGLYFSAVESVMSTNNKQLKTAGKYIMEHTKNFKYGAEKEMFNPGPVSELLGSGEEKLMLGGDDNGGTQDVYKESN